MTTPITEQASGVLGSPSVFSSDANLNSHKLTNVAAGVSSTDGVNKGQLDSVAIAGKNRVINGNFNVNQRGYVSGTATGVANQYTLDRWRVVTSGQSITFAASGNGNLVTAPAGGLEQVIEGNNIEGGTFTLNWTGTATATLGGSSITKGAQATLTANTNVTLRFTGGTVGLVQLEAGSVASPFERRMYGQELALCQRYYEKVGGEAQYDIILQGYNAAASSTSLWVPYKVTKRTAPTVTKVGTWAVTNAAQPVIISSASTAGFALQTQTTTLSITGFNTVDATTYVTANAEL